MDDRDLSDDESGHGLMAAMDGSEAFHQVVKDMLLNGHQVSKDDLLRQQYGVWCVVVGMVGPSSGLVVREASSSWLSMCGGHACVVRATRGSYAGLIRWAHTLSTLTRSPRVLA